MNKPTPEELAAFVDAFPWGSGLCPTVDRRDFARAVLDKWGQPAHSGEPVAYYQPDDPSSSSAFSWPGSERNTAHNKPLFTAPQPVEQEPLSPEQRSAAFARAEKKMQSNINLSWRDAIVDEIEAAHGITPKGGQHGTE